MRVRRLLLVLVAIAAATNACSDDGGTASPTGTREAFCTELRAVVEADLTIFDPLHPAGPDDTETATTRLADAAPAEVADDMRLLADTFAAVTAVLDEVDPSDPARAERIEALDIDDEEIAAAQAAVTGFALAQCRIDLAAINAASVTTSSTETTTVPGTVPPTTLPPATVVTTTVPPVTG
jgi:hypothetical protein